MAIPGEAANLNPGIYTQSPPALDRDFSPRLALNQERDMTERHIPYFKLYPADFMNGVRGLSAQEVGAYMMILCRIYEENGPIEANPLKLSTYCGMREKTFAAVMAKLVDLGKFYVEDGMIFNSRAMREISSRSDDLKNNSLAGKKSAEKRRKNNDTMPTDDQRPFNHTDTDTDTYKNDVDDSARASLPSDATRREELIHAMNAQPISATGRVFGNTADMAEAKRWDELGLSHSQQIDIITETMSRKHDGKPPASFRYFSGAMQNAAAELARPNLDPVQRGSPTRQPQNIDHIWNELKQGVTK